MIEVNCPKCGNNRFAFPRHITDDSVIVCETCGYSLGTFAELKERIGEEVIARSVRERKKPPES